MICLARLIFYDLLPQKLIPATWDVRSRARTCVFVADSYN